MLTERARLARPHFPGFGAQSVTSGLREDITAPFLNLIRHAHKWDEARQHYGQIKVPVLVIYGDHAGPTKRSDDAQLRLFRGQESRR